MATTISFQLINIACLIKIHMKKVSFLSLLLFTFSVSIAQLKYPETKKDNQADTYFGTSVLDPYRWLEDDNSESTKAWVTQENQVTNDYFSKIPYRQQWLERLEALNNYPKYSSPFHKNDYYYFYKNDGLQNQSVLYRQKGLNGVPEQVIDPNTFSKDGTTILATFSLSKDGRYAVVGKSTGGSDWRTYQVMDMNTLSYLPDSLAWIKVSGANWKGNGFFYSRYPAGNDGRELSVKNEHHQVYFHIAGTAQSQDKLVFEEPANPLQFNGVSTSEDERYVFLNINDRSKVRGMHFGTMTAIYLTKHLSH
jgi:prolyl oligopeptidase